MLLLWNSAYLRFLGLAFSLAVSVWKYFVWSLNSAVNACMHKHQHTLMSLTTSLFSIWRQSSETGLCCVCVYMCRALCTCAACQWEMHINSAPGPLLSNTPTRLSFSVLSWLPSHLQTSLSYLVWWLSASPRWQWWMFAQDYYQLQHTLSHSARFSWTTAKFKYPSSFFPFQIYPLSSVLSDLGVSCSALSLAEDWSGMKNYGEMSACGAERGYIWSFSDVGGKGACSWWLGRVYSCCLGSPFVSLMTRPRKVSCSIQKALRVILPDDGCFPSHLPGGGEKRVGDLCPLGNHDAFWRWLFAIFATFYFVVREKLLTTPYLLS